jgi:glycosyltransferase involved in cell wall biosynthesis
VKVSLVATVKDAGQFVGEFLESVAGQTHPPDEVVIVDGGSTDATVATLRRHSWVTLIEETGANIARGRNVAVAAAAHDVIAVSDADCVLDPQWLERLLRPLRRGADVAMGGYRPLSRSFFQVVASAVSVKDLEEISEEAFMPSSRSVAFRRDAFEAAGGYPEWLEIGEDMWLDIRWRELAVRMELALDAVAYWRAREDLSGHWQQYAAYARGDALAGMHARRHALRFATYGALVAAIALRRPRLVAGAVLAGGVYAARPVRRAFHRLDNPAQQAAAILAVPALMVATDLAKEAGYLQGLRDRYRRS